MNPSEIPNHQEDGLRHIDELLNSFLDGELDERHQTEVQRLIDHDKKIAERLQSLRKCKRLVSSLPYAEAPDGMLENIKASLEGKEIPVSAARPVSFSSHRQHQGARHLLLRRLTSVAAMIALVAVLGVVIYSILAPEVTTTDMPVAVETETQPREVAAVVKPAEITPFTGRLELKTSSLPEVAAFLNKAIELNVPAGRWTAAGTENLNESHVLTCSRQNLKTILDDLGTIWDKIGSATLFINTDRPQGQIVIDAVTPSQVIEIAKQDDFQTQIKTAKFFAAMNNITERSPGKEVLVAIDNSTPGLLTIPKPVLTSSEKPAAKPSAQTEDSRVVRLTITVSE
jgi:anti-sigma factor RsiW